MERLQIPATGEATIFFELKPDYANIINSQVTHHIWRVEYISKAVLSNIREHATAHACANDEKDLFMSRQHFDHPADYSLPKIFIEHRIGPFYFLDAWKNPKGRRRPATWNQNWDDLIARNLHVHRQRNVRQRTR